MKEKKCLACGSNIWGRSDKKFCSDVCRNNFNNKLNSCANKLVRNTNNILRRNRRILLQLTTIGRSKITRSGLLEKGFDFSHMTSIYTDKEGLEYRFCYEYGYLSIEEELYTLVKNSDLSDQDNSFSTTKL